MACAGGDATAERHSRERDRTQIRLFQDFRDLTRYDAVVDTLQRKQHVFSPSDGADPQPCGSQQAGIFRYRGHPIREIPCTAHALLGRIESIFGLRWLESADDPSIGKPEIGRVARMSENDHHITMAGDIFQQRGVL